MFLSGVLSKRDGRAEELDVDGVALALPPVAGKGDRQLWATDGHAPVLSDDRGVVGICTYHWGWRGRWRFPCLFWPRRYVFFFFFTLFRP